MRTLASAIVLGLPVLLAVPAAAHIACDGDFQIVEGREIATPYCADKTIARVARQLGDNVSGRQVRNNPGTKDEVCRFVGNDPAVYGDCANTDN